MLNELISEKNIQFIDHLSGWEEAIAVSAQPLLNDNSIEPSYIEAILENVHKLGPYIVIGPGIALPHARPETGVNKVGMSFLKLKQPVYFSEDKPVTLFFCLAAVDNSAHLKALSELTKLLCENNNLEKLQSFTTVSQVKDLLEQYSTVQYQL